MSAQIIGKSSDSLAFGVPLLACTRRAAAKTGVGGLAYFFPYNPLGPRFPDIHASFSISNAISMAMSVALFSCVRKQNYPLRRQPLHLIWLVLCAIVYLLRSTGHLRTHYNTSIMSLEVFACFPLNI